MGPFTERLELFGIFGERNPLLDHLLNLLSMLVFEANTGGFNTNEIEAILSLFLSTVKLRYDDDGCYKKSWKIKWL